MTDYNVMPDYQTRRKIINDICEKYSFVHHSFAGKSVCGRCIDVLHIGNTKNCVLYCAGFHGSEYLTVTAVLKFFEQCADAMENDSVVGRYKIRDFLREKGLTIVPCVNPDGVEIAIHGSDAALKYKSLVEKASKENKVWQAHARGVDINHNFNAGWNELKNRELSMNIKAPSATRFGGNQLAVLPWEGVADDKGKPAVVTPEGVAALMEHWLLADAFEREYLAGLYALDSEKNA